MGVAAPPAGVPGGNPGVYSNTNYLVSIDAAPAAFHRLAANG
ncbi:hypothetical protein RKD47_000136 [Streptomyces albogriseolus]